MESQNADLGDFQGKGTPMPKFLKSDCVHLRDNTDIRPRNVRGESPIITLLHDMIADDLMGRFLFQVDFRHYAFVSKENRFTVLAMLLPLWF